MRRGILIIMLLLFAVTATAYNTMDVHLLYKNTTTGGFLNGSYSTNVTFYNQTGDTVLFSEQVDIDYRNGTGNYLIGMVNTIDPYLFYSDVYWQIKIGTTLFAPRNISYVGKAFYSDHAKNAALLDNQLPSYYLDDTDTNTWNSTEDILAVFLQSQYTVTNNSLEITESQISDLSHTVDTTIGNCSGTNCNIGWGNLTSIPADLADGDDVGSGADNCSGKNCDFGWGNITSIPADIADGDDTGSGSENCSGIGDCSTLVYLDYNNSGGFNLTGRMYLEGHNTGDVLSGEYDLEIGQDYGAIEIGEFELFMTSETIAGMDFNGSVVLRNEFSGGSNNEFMFVTSDNLIRFIIPKSGAELATYNPGSMMVGGEHGQTFGDNATDCQTQGYTQIDCNTSISGADLGVQDDLEVQGAIYTNDWTNVSITESQVSDLVHITDTDTWNSTSDITTVIDNERGATNRTDADIVTVAESNNFIRNGTKSLYFHATANADKISFYDDRIGATNNYGIGMQSNTIYFKLDGSNTKGYEWYSDKNYDGVNFVMELEGDGDLWIKNATTTDKLTVTQNISSTGNVDFNGFHIDKYNSTHYKLWGE